MRVKVWQCELCGVTQPGPSIDLDMSECWCGRGRGRWGVAYVPQAPAELIAKMDAKYGRGHYQLLRKDGAWYVDI
jgi:hypothetical protein